MGEDGRIDYVELPGGDLVPPKRFYEQAFGWSFTDYGPSYAAFDEGLDGGFNTDAADQARAPLVILYADDLEAMAAKGRPARGGDPARPLGLPRRPPLPFPRPQRQRAGGVERELMSGRQRLIKR